MGQDLYVLMNFCSGQGFGAVWTNTYRDYGQNEERVQGEEIISSQIPIL